MHICALIKLVQRARLIRREFQNSRGRRWTSFVYRGLIKTRRLTEELNGRGSIGNNDRENVRSMLSAEGKERVHDRHKRVRTRFDRAIVVKVSRNREAAGKLTSAIVDLAVRCGRELGKLRLLRGRGGKEKRQKFRMTWGDSYLGDGRTTAAISRRTVRTSGLG